VRINLLSQKTVNDFVSKYPLSKSELIHFTSALKAADWNKPTDIQETFNTADLLGKSSNRVVFDIGGNNWRVICGYKFREKEVSLFICWIGTHTEYDKLCAKKEQYTIFDY